METIAKELERARSALFTFNADERLVWIHRGMEIKHEFDELGFELWDEWSATSRSYNSRDARNAWKSFKNNAGGRTIKSLFHAARKAGWRDTSVYERPSPSELARRLKQRSEREAQLAAFDDAARALAAKRAADIWHAAELAPPAHPYLNKKGIQAHGARVGTWREEIKDRTTGETSEVVICENALLIKIQDEDKKIHSLQAIFESSRNALGRDRTYLRNGAKAGHFYTFGKPIELRGKLVIVIAEGFATAASIHQCTGHAAVAAFDAGNLLATAMTMRRRFPDADIVIFSDRDSEVLRLSTGTKAALKAALAANARIVVPEWTGQKGRDANDMYRDGFTWRGVTVPGTTLLMACVNFATPCHSSAFVEMLDECGIQKDDPDHVGAIVGAHSVAQEVAPSESEYTTDQVRVLEPILSTYDDIDAALLQSATQDAVALVFRRQYAGRFLYAHDRKCWFEWDGTRWRYENTELAFDFARRLARKLNIEGNSGPSTASFCSGVERFVRADRAFAVRGGEFDVDNYLLNTPTGTLDLRSGAIRKHDPGDRISKTTKFSPAEVGGARFRLFLSEITGGDESKARFLQISLGACLSGAIESHWMLFWTGSGRNGKNTLGDLVMEVLGDYAKKISSGTLMAKLHEGHPTEIANLQGARLVVSSEVEDGAHWHESRINELTGDKTLSGRFMHGNFFEFVRTHKHLVYGNHRPQLRSVTDALKSRIKIVPFQESFLGREDPLLPTKLLEDGGYVLHWLIEGHAAWVAAGHKLPICKAIEAESRDYFESQSTIERWIHECVEVLPDDGRAASSWPTATTLYVNYKDWKSSRGEQPVSQTRWGEVMGKQFPKKNANGVRYVGASLMNRF